MLSVGGGTPCYDNNIELIIKYGVSFYLKASLQTLYKRLLKEKNSRPLIKNIDDFTFDDFELINYQHHPHIKGAVSV